MKITSFTDQGKSPIACVTVPRKPRHVFTVAINVPTSSNDLREILTYLYILPNISTHEKVSGMKLFIAEVWK